MKFDDSMKVLVSRDEIHAFVRELFTDGGPIQKNYDQGGYVYDIVDQFADYPRVFAEPTNLDVEWTHYYPYMSVILFADYGDKPHVQDLRYLHEMYHCATQPYLPSNRRSMAALEKKNFDNEDDASTVTEMEIYLAIPELRQYTFPHPILIDRILFPGGDVTKPDQDLIDRWHERPGEVFRHLKYTRLHYVNADESELLPEERDDPTIGWLRGYPDQKYVWLDVWADHYGTLEDAMLKFQSETKELGREIAAQNHIKWLKSVSKNNVPFYEAAEKFAPAYVERITEYNEDMKASGHKPVARKDNSSPLINTDNENNIDTPEIS